MSKETVKNLESLRNAMKKVHVDAMIIPGTDAHQSEYVGEHWKMRNWVTGFTGSNGTAVVTLTDAGLWTDSRYFLQAEAQLQDSGVILYKEDIKGEPTINGWLAGILEEDSVIAIDGTLFSLSKAAELEAFCGVHGFRLATDFKPFDTIWEDRPPRPQDKAFVHDESFAGESVESKINRVLEAIERLGAESQFISALDEIAWLFNIRCSDIAYNPVLMSYAYISEAKKVLFVDAEKLDADVKKHLKSNDIDIKPYEDALKFVSKLPALETILIDPNVVSDTFAHAMECEKIYAKSPIVLLKAIKNEVQLEGTRAAMERDGIALIKMFMWLEKAVPAGSVTELDVAGVATKYRSEHPCYRGDSFETICGYREHGAIVHYSATKDSASTLYNEGLLLLDSGAQYLDGTTDITRTISLGSPTTQEIHDYTLVLKGHIAIATQIFPVGTRGSQLDALARQFLWKEGLSYLHGTGHGVGHFLGVHEAPQNIRLNENPAMLVPGMITSDEPGLYRAGKHGIRIENLVLTVPAFHTEEFGDFLKFETLTLCPYDSTLIDTTMLNDEELAWVNSYHEMVSARLSPYLNEEQVAWLNNKTKQLNK